MVACGINGAVSNMPTGYLCNTACFHILKKCSGKVELLNGEMRMHYFRIKCLDYHFLLHFNKAPWRMAFCLSGSGNTSKKQRNDS